MLTVRQIERLWTNKAYGRMLRLCLEMRPESSVRLLGDLSHALPAAAMAVIRLDELNQSAAPFAAAMLRTLLAAQESDGGWGDPLATALCTRALLCSNGQGPAIDRALTHLADLQKSDGLWPRIPLRRLPGDPFVTAFILYHLGDHAPFQNAVNLPDALGWFDTHPSSLDLETAKLWRSLSLRFQTPLPSAA